MKIFQVQILQCDPTVIIANDADEANLILLNRLIDALGHVPNAKYAVTEWRPKRDEGHEPLWQHVTNGVRGITWHEDGTWPISI